MKNTKLDEAAALLMQYAYETESKTLTYFADVAFEGNRRIIINGKPMFIKISVKLVEEMPSQH